MREWESERVRAGWEGTLQLIQPEGKTKLHKYCPSFSNPKRKLLQPMRVRQECKERFKIQLGHLQTRSFWTLPWKKCGNENENLQITRSDWQVNFRGEPFSSLFVYKLLKLDPLATSWFHKTTLQSKTKLLSVLSQICATLKLIRFSSHLPLMFQLMFWHSHVCQCR